jgi:hypothetical protein
MTADRMPAAYQAPVLFERHPHFMLLPVKGGNNVD